MAVLEALEALKKASKDIEDSSDDPSSPSMKALLELETGSGDLLSGDPKLFTLSSLLSRLKSLAGKPLRRRLLRRKSPSEISRVAGSIGSELQSWIDRKTLDRLSTSSTSDEERTNLLLALESRLSRGFDRRLQQLLLQSRAFSAIESILSDTKSSKRIRDLSALVVLAMVRFNKSVFVGEVLMGPTVRSLIAIASAATLTAVNGLISAVRSPIVDDLHANGEICKIVGLLTSDDAEVRALALETVLEIGYYGRKEAADAMIEAGVVERLVELQRSDLGGTLMEMDGPDESGGVIKVGGLTVGIGERDYLDGCPFASCVSRFAVQMEVGEGLRQREKRALKLEVLRRVREAVTSPAEMGTLMAEVLWGSTYW